MTDIDTTDKQTDKTDMQALHDSTRTLVMGVLNITEDSFSDGGLWLESGAAARHGRDMIAVGADIIDIGAESTRPGAKRVSEADELARITGAVKALAPTGVTLSIDTTRASVAKAALDEGAQIINDVSGCRLDRELPRSVADHDCLYIVQHWRGWLAGSHGATPTPTPRTTSTACSTTCAMNSCVRSTTCSPPASNRSA